MSGANLNRQPGPMNEDALAMLREEHVRKGTIVHTSDGQFLGKALKIHHRLKDVDPDLKLYASYLDVSNLAVGSSIYIPVEFISAYDAQGPSLTLSVPLSAVMGETWDREPTFIAGKQDKIEYLAV